MGVAKTILILNKEFIKQDISSLLPDVVYEIDGVKQDAIEEKKDIAIEIAKNLNEKILMVDTKLSEIVKPLRGVVSERCIHEYIVVGSNQDSSLSAPYKHFLICIKCTYLEDRYLIKPYAVGKEKRIISNGHSCQCSKVIEDNPLAIFLLLKVSGQDDIQLKIIREEHLINKETEKAIPVAAGIGLQ